MTVSFYGSTIVLSLSIHLEFVMNVSKYTTWNIPRSVVPRACHDDDRIKKALIIECCRIFCERTIPISAITALTITSLIALLTYQEINAPLLKTSLLVLLIIALTNIALVERLRHTNYSRHWELSLLLWMTVTSSCVWGFAGLAMAMITNPMIGFICLLVLAGAMAFTTIMLCAIPSLVRIHLLAVSLPTALGFFIYSEEPNHLLAILIILFAAYLITLSNTIFEKILGSIRVALKKDAMPNNNCPTKKQINRSLAKAEYEITNHSRNQSTSLAMLPGVTYCAEIREDCWVLTDVSENSESLFRHKPESLIGKQMLHLCDEINTNGRSINKHDLIKCAQSGTCFEVEYALCNSNGDERWVVERVRARLNKRGDLVSVEGIIIDVTEKLVLPDKHMCHTTYDALTALPDRDEFNRSLQETLDVMKHKPMEHAVLLLSLDHCKIINDIYGRAAADKLLCQVSRRLSVYIHESDTLARVNDDTFSVLLNGCSVNQAKRLAKLMRDALNKEWFTWDNNRFNVRASFGIALINHLCLDAETVLNCAEQACALAKEQGEDCTQIYRDRDIKIVKCQNEKYWALRIPEAIEADNLYLVCQAITPLEDSHAQGIRYEVLLRLRDPNGSTINPGAFLPGAERYNLMKAIDEWVIDRVLTGLHDNPEHLKDLDTCFINISGQSLGNAEFLDNVLARLELSGIAAQRLCFEITETAAITNFSQALRFIQTLKTRGANFALDDFGSGLSTFEYLRKLPVDFLKIDGAFVREIAHNSVSRAMLNSINEFGHLTGKKTIAEFVENEAILDELQRMGIDYGQGYAISQPVPFEDLLQRHVVIDSQLPNRADHDCSSILPNSELHHCSPQENLKLSTCSRSIPTTDTMKQDSSQGMIDFQQAPIDSRQYDNAVAQRV